MSEDRVLLDERSSAPGIRFEHAWEKREQTENQGQTFYLISRKDLIASMTGVGLNVDLEDVQVLERSDEELPKGGRGGDPAAASRRANRRADPRPGPPAAAI